MDRDSVRLILVVVGLLVLAGVYLWGRFRTADRAGEEVDQPWLDDGTSSDFAEDDDDPLGLRSPGLRKEPHMSGLDRPFRDEDEPPEEDAHTHHSHGDLNTEGADGAPFLIQISVVAGPGRVFRGADLMNAFMDTDLLHGDMGIFHRYDPELTQTLFSVASLVEPGSFPIEDMDAFECPGIVLFFQTARVSDPLEVYDDLVNTSRELARQLHGIQWDELRQPLTASKIAHMRHLLK